MQDIPEYGSGSGSLATGVVNSAANSGAGWLRRIGIPTLFAMAALT